MSDAPKRAAFFEESGTSPPGPLCDGVDAGDGCCENPTALPRRWRQEAERLRSLEAHGQAAALEQAANDLDAAITTLGDETLSISEAAAVSGYSEEHLRRLVRAGDLPAERNSGRGSRIHIRRRDLPIKRRKDGRETPGGIAYDPDEDARGIAKLMEAKR